MDPHEQFCHTPPCPDRGQSGKRVTSASIAGRNSGIAVAPVGGPLRPQQAHINLWQWQRNHG
jgi:hypothetical protein